MTWWLLVLSLCAALAFWWWRAGWTRGISADHLRTKLQEFLGYAANGGILDLHTEGSPAFVQIRMLGDPERRPEILVGVPEMAWSQPYFDDLVSSLEAAGFPIECELAPKPGLPVSRWLMVHHKDPDAELIESFHRAVVHIFQHLGVPAAATFKIRYRGVVGPQAWARLRGTNSRAA